MTFITVQGHLFTQPFHKTRSMLRGWHGGKPQIEQYHCSSCQCIHVQNDNFLRYDAWVIMCFSFGSEQLFFRDYCCLHLKGKCFGYVQYVKLLTWCTMNSKSPHIYHHIKVSKKGLYGNNIMVLYVSDIHTLSLCT